MFSITLVLYPDQPLCHLWSFSLSLLPLLSIILQAVLGPVNICHSFPYETYLSVTPDEKYTTRSSRKTSAIQYHGRKVRRHRQTGENKVCLDVAKSAVTISQDWRSSSRCRLLILLSSSERERGLSRGYVQRPIAEVINV